MSNFIFRWNVAMSWRVFQLRPMFYELVNSIKNVSIGNFILLEINQSVNYFFQRLILFNFKSWVFIILLNDQLITKSSKKKSSASWHLFIIYSTLNDIVITERKEWNEQKGRKHKSNWMTSLE